MPQSGFQNVVFFFDFSPNFGPKKTALSPLNYSEKCVYTKAMDPLLPNFAYKFI